MKSLLAGSFTSVLILFFLSSLSAKGDESPILFIDSINLLILNEESIADEKNPRKFIESESFEISFSDDGVALPDSYEADTIYNVSLADVPSGNYTFEAIARILDQISEALIERGYYGVAVTVDPDQIDIETGEDFRNKDDQSLNLKVWLGEVVERRTIAKGTRIKGDDLINNSKHRKILKNSPFNKHFESQASDSILINKDILDVYVGRLNRLRNRTVYMALSRADKVNEYVLDYLVIEPKPWVGYVQVSNTGTEATGEWRERIGGVYYQVTNNDDILSIDYFTAEFDSANAAIAAYEIPLVMPDYLKFKAYGSYSDFTAENLIIETGPDAEGTTISYGAEFAYTPFYYMEHFFTAVLGFRYEDISVEGVFANEGIAEFLSPYLRLEITKNKLEHTSIFSCRYEKNIKDNNQNEFQNLGRQFLADDFSLFSFRFYQSFFVEPLLPGYDEAKPGKWLSNSLVHELAFSLRGQYLEQKDARLAPQKQFYAGGFFSVRGYNESAARGDEGIIGSIEYRLHLARLLKPLSLLDEEVPERQSGTTRTQERFNYRAPSLYGFPDWDLLVRGFIDWAKLSINSPLNTEIEQDLLSYGLGFEFQYQSRFNVRLDYGIIDNALESSSATNPIEEDGDVGDSRFHLLATYTF